jgi:hypothetical protein
MSAKFFSVCHEWFDTLRPEGLQSECACQGVWSEAGGAAAEVIADLAGICRRAHRWASSGSGSYNHTRTANRIVLQ